MVYVFSTIFAIIITPITLLRNAFCNPENNIPKPDKVKTDNIIKFEKEYLKHAYEIGITAKDISNEEEYIIDMLDMSGCDENFIRKFMEVTKCRELMAAARFGKISYKEFSKGYFIIYNCKNYMSYIVKFLHIYEFTLRYNGLDQDLLWTYMSECYGPKDVLLKLDYIQPDAECENLVITFEPIVFWNYKIRPR